MGFELAAVAAMLLSAASPAEEPQAQPQPPLEAAVEAPPPAATEAPVAAPAAPEPHTPAPPSALQVEDGGGHVRFVLLDAPMGTSVVLAPGKYRVRRGDPSTGVWGPASPVTLEPGQQLVVPEAGVTLVGRVEALAPPQVSPTTLPAHTMEARVGLGLVASAKSLDYGMTGRPAVQLGFSWGVTDRVQLGLLNVSYRVGRRGGVEFVPCLGLGGVFDLYGRDPTAIGLGSSSLEGDYFAMTPTLRAGLRGWIGERWAVNATGEGSLGLQFPRKDGNVSAWSVGAGLGISYFAWEHAVVNFGVRYGYGEEPGTPTGKGQEVAIGSVQSLGGRILPLFAVELSRGLTLETQMVVVLREREVDARELRVVEAVAITW